ncbi:MAG: metalloprotease family protein [Chitinophagales bacterium]
MIPGFLIAILTFPGVMVHEIAHQLFCRFARVSVFEVVYFQFKNPVGYVLHEIPSQPWQHILIGIGPFIVNTVIGAIIAAPAAVQVIKFDTGGPLEYFLIWLGVSIAMHSFPSTGDANSIWAAIKNKETPILTKIVATPIIIIIFICAVGSVVWLDLIYGLAVTMLIPNLIVHLMV